MKSYCISVLGFLVIYLVACTGNDSDGFKVTDSGLRYKFIIDKDGDSPEIDDIMVLHLAYSTSKDSILFDSNSESDSFLVKLVEPTFAGGVEEGFAKMSPGDSVILKVPADSIFQVTFFSKTPQYITPGSDLTFRVKMKSFIKRSVYDSIEKVTDIKSREAEFEKLEAYFTERDLHLSPTENGLYYQINRVGVGRFPQNGDTIEVKYTGALLGGKIFDNSDWKEEPFKFVLGENMVLPGWEEGMPYLNEGSQARFFITSDLAFGNRYVGEVPPYSTLVFDIEVIDIIDGR